MIVCDNCGNEFEVTELQQRVHPDDIKQMYFTCPDPDCDAEYTAYYTNSKVAELQALTISQWRQMNTTPAHKQAKLLKKIEQTKREIKSEMDRIKALVS